MKIRVTVTTEYEANPDHYPPGSSPKQMAEIDRENMLSDPLLIWSVGDGEPKITVEPVGKPKHRPNPAEIEASVTEDKNG